MKSNIRLFALLALLAAAVLAVGLALAGDEPAKTGEAAKTSSGCSATCSATCTGEEAAAKVETPAPAVPVEAGVKPACEGHAAHAVHAVHAAQDGAAVACTHEGACACPQCKDGKCEPGKCDCSQCKDGKCVCSHTAEACKAHAEACAGHAAGGEAPAEATQAAVTTTDAPKAGCGGCPSAKTGCGGK
ncbi:MAG: hypothetical protein AB7V45_04950 [Candidatus Krumholzibacteriia bacterium]